MKTAGWLNAAVFGKFYDKDIVDGCFDVSDLCGGQKKLLWNLSNLPERPDAKRG